jgi:hypothetical protein
VLPLLGPAAWGGTGTRGSGPWSQSPQARGQAGEDVAGAQGQGQRGPTRRSAKRCSDRVQRRRYHPQAAHARAADRGWAYQARQREGEAVRTVQERADRRGISGQRWRLEWLRRDVKYGHVGVSMVKVTPPRSVQSGSSGGNRRKATSTRHKRTLRLVEVRFLPALAGNARSAGGASGGHARVPSVRASAHSAGCVLAAIGIGLCRRTVSGAGRRFGRGSSAGRSGPGAGGSARRICARVLASQR